MRVLHPKAGEQDLRVRIRHVVAVAVRIKQQVGRLQDEYSAMTKRQPAGQVQAVDEILGPVRAAIAISVLKDGYAVGALGSARRRFGDFVIHGSRKAVHFDALEAGRVGILQVLNDPKPPAIVKLYRHRLRDHRLAGEEVGPESVRQGHVRHRLVRCVALGRRARNERKTNPEQTK